VRTFRSAWETVPLLANDIEPTRVARGQRSTNRKALAQINLHWHDLRHEALSRLADDSVPVHELQMPAGHASSTTTRRYLNARRTRLPNRCGRRACVTPRASPRPMKTRFRWGEMRLNALPIASRSSADDGRLAKSSNMARLAGIEPAGPAWRLERTRPCFRRSP
jgi:hypothetical protein